MVKNILVPPEISNKYKDHKVFIDNNYFDNLEAILSKYNNYLIITDKIIYQKLNNYLSFAFNNIHIFAENIKAETIHVEKITDIGKNYDIFIAIGSGTINDIVKYASYKLNKNYILFATAPSMNGYLSDSASLISNNYKKSYKAKLALHAYFDLNIIAKSPKRLIQAGIGDSLCSHICRADMILANFLLAENYNEHLFEMSYEIEDNLFPHIEKIFKNDQEKIYLLLNLLINSGYAMSIYGKSSPASQSEHMIAHLYEALTEKKIDFYHGEVIAVTSYYSNALWDNFLMKDIVPKLRERSDNNDSVKFDIIDKKLDINSVNNILSKNFQKIKNQVRKRYKTIEELKNILCKSDLAYLPHDLGLDPDIFYYTAKNAYLTRDRFTILDLN